MTQQASAHQGETMRLKDKVAIVTGGAQGFGLGIVETFAREGAKVVVLDLNEEGAKAAAKPYGRKAFGMKCDVSKAKDVQRAVAKAVERFGTIDVLINNAGTSHRNRPMLEVDEATFDRVFDVNVKSIFHFAHAVIPVMRQNGGGAIINVGSTAGIRPRPGLAWYNASKGAVNLLTKSMAVELAPDKIRVCALAPVAGDTPLLGTFMGEDTPEMRKKFIASIPMGRLSTPKDIADAALFLAGDPGNFLTGVVLEVDGGRCI
jgi:3-oxoacyl-[acyl-carrier protein] reductase